MNILLLEDDDYKNSRITTAISQQDSSAHIVHCDNATDALTELRKGLFDLMIVDLCIPIRKNARAKDKGGLDFVNQMKHQIPHQNLPKRIVALTAFDHLKQKLQDDFAAYGWLIIKYSNDSTDWEIALSNVLHDCQKKPLTAKILIALHGIRTLAGWQRTLADVSWNEGWFAPVDGWWYGNFSVLEFLFNFRREKKVEWLRKTYSNFLTEYKDIASVCPPSVIAHSFGTYLIGHTLLKYKDVKVDQIILCGSILPVQFPWEELIRNGQVDCVYNFIGTRDVWPRVASWVIPGCGQSGYAGFRGHCASLYQERHHLKHSDFFDKAQMRQNWFSKLRQSPLMLKNVRPKPLLIKLPSGDHPLISAVLSKIVIVFIIVVAICFLYLASKLYVYLVDTLLQYFLVNFSYGLG